MPSLIWIAAKHASSRKKYIESEHESKTRQIGNFLELEKKLPLVPTRYNYSIVDELTAHLGTRNPFGKPADPDKHDIWLFDTNAYKRAGEWRAHCLIAFFQKHIGGDVGKLISEVIAKLCERTDTISSPLIQTRLHPFLVSIQPARYTYSNVANRTWRQGPSSSSGLSSSVVTIKDIGQSNRSRTNWSVVNPAFNSSAEMRHVSGSGWGIITDIDDTIKITNTSSAIDILSKTFLEPFEAVEGMPELFRELKELLHHPAFWYLSASPYNLYQFLREFRDQNQFPFGELMLRELCFVGLGGLLKSSTKGTQMYKVEKMKLIHSRFPRRTFICIGDSVATDPEAYAQIYRLFPDWIRLIFIRKVPIVGRHILDYDYNTNERFQTAFEGVPTEVWHTFTDPREVEQRVRQMVDKLWIC